MLPVTGVLGENATDALNALVSVRALGGGRRPCARRLPVRSSLFPYSTVVDARGVINSLDAFSVFEAVVVDDSACD